jgi:nucleotide-binding universal stress UspA family protein
MPGIIVGIDGSRHSRRALEWAVSEAAMRRVPLIVLSVNQAIAGFKKLLLGSVSTQVAHHAHVPVVVIPSDIG